MAFSVLAGGSSATFPGQPLTHNVRAQSRRKARFVTSAVSTAHASGRLPTNVAGDLFVNNKCIDCDACRAIAPEVYKAAAGAAAVHHQPVTDEEKRKAYQALVSCPVGAIRTDAKTKEVRDEIRDAAASLPSHISLDLPGVFFNGYTDRKTFGARSYTLLAGDATRRAAVMFDSPRFSEPLAAQIEALAGGSDGIKYMVLSHRDDVGDHAKWAARFPLKRVIHRRDVSKRSGTDKCEVILDGDGPWSLDDAPGLEVIGVPGHTAGCVALHVPERKVLFTGDHLAFSGRTGALSGFPRYNWFSWEKQVESMQKLVDLDFLWILPGHGRPHHFETAQQRKEEMRELVNRMPSER